MLALVLDIRSVGEKVDNIATHRRSWWELECTRGTLTLLYGFIEEPHGLAMQTWAFP